MGPKKRAIRRGIARKLFVAFSLLLAIFGAASVSALAGLLELHEGLHSVEREAGRMQRMLRLASAVRDQYAHMAHTIILGDDSHLGMYRDAAAGMAATAKEVESRIRTPDERALLARILEASHELDAIFQDQLLPAVRRGDKTAAAAPHDRILQIVFSAQENAEKLSRASEQSIAGFNSHAQAVQHVAILGMLILMVAGFACAVGVAIYLHRSFARPIAALAEGSARIAAGDLDTQLAVGTKDELGDLAAQFNAMTKAVKDHQGKLVQSEKLAGIGRLAAGVAHEINNPLGVILGYVKLLRRKADPAIDADLKIVEDEAEQCRQVVEDLLDLTRTPPLEAEPVDLRVLCEDIVRRIETSLGKPCREIAIRGEGVVSGSGRKLHQVIHNLIKNAVEAAGADGRVAVNIERSIAGTVTVAVFDSGPGIKPQERDLVFEPFFTTKPSGSGLGLAVSRAIARAHGGDLELASEFEQGTTFRLSLPTERKAAA